MNSKETAMTDFFNMTYPAISSQISKRSFSFKPNGPCMRFNYREHARDYVLTISRPLTRRRFQPRSTAYFLAFLAKAFSSDTSSSHWAAKDNTCLHTSTSRHHHNHYPDKVARHLSPSPTYGHHQVIIRTRRIPSRTISRTAQQQEQQPHICQQKSGFASSPSSLRHTGPKHGSTCVS